ncbi:MAG: hypothetical protein MR958_03980 [Spirochaetia bacterium]|nr:hypothetical protein [Spirochaetia bacterium]MDD7269459.1 hypothetical protein [Treponema sp.]
MTDSQWKAFCDFKKIFIEKIDEWNKRCPQLQVLQEAAAKAANTPSYSFETPIVYNRDLDRFTRDDDIKLIVIGDNPGKDEQLLKNNKYLVGQAGKIADGFFKRNPELGVDFRKNVIILNKTPVHSAKTNQLKHIIKNGGVQVAALIQESQLWMAEQTAKLHSALCSGASGGGVAPELWLVGYAELKGKGIFIPYRDKLKESYGVCTAGTDLAGANGTAGTDLLVSGAYAWSKVYVFQHFSMNRFTIDLGELTEEHSWDSLSLIDRIHKAGDLHKSEIF